MGSAVDEFLLPALAGQQERVAALLGDARAAAARLSRARVGGAWSGEAANAFEERLDALQRGCSELSNALESALRETEGAWVAVAGRS